jgi:hypothetical protein
MTFSVKNIVLGICASGLAVVGAFASYTGGTRYKVKKPGGTFLIVKGVACEGHGDMQCVVKVKTFSGTTTIFEKATLFDKNGFTVFGESYLPSTLHTLGE